jgi:hypothetical protein
MDDLNKQIIAPRSLAAICAEHTRRVQLLTVEFYSGKLSMQEYRKRSRELTQGLVDELKKV